MYVLLLKRILFLPSLIYIPLSLLSFHFVCLDMLVFPLVDDLIFLFYVKALFHISSSFWLAVAVFL